LSELIVVGTGIRAVVQLTPEARRSIASADRVLYLVSDAMMGRVIEELNPGAESLHSLYSNEKSRSTTYDEMVDLMVESVRAGNVTCAVFYGHPGAFASPGHQAVHRVRAEGYSARMLPGISAEDCMFADLGVDPGASGCQSYLAYDFLVRPRSFDTTTPLVLWQISSFSDSSSHVEQDDRGIQMLGALLTRHYGPDHEVVVYEAAVYPVGSFTADRVPVGELDRCSIPDLASLYVPPIGRADRDTAVHAQLEGTSS
jgi:uncharacterized protein YabN with tetrapyrrole methylase and pyrophosphatase domain